MSYKLVPYLVNLNTLRSVVFNHDLDVVEKIRESVHGKRDGHDLSLIDAVEQIVRGEIDHPDCGYQYGYALQALCEHLGERLEVNHWNHVRWATLENTGLNAIIGKGCPITLPPIPDFPTIGHVPLKDIQRLVNRIGKNSKKTMDPAHRELLQEYESWLMAANRQQCDMVLFYY